MTIKQAVITGLVYLALASVPGVLTAIWIVSEIIGGPSW